MKKALFLLLLIVFTGNTLYSQVYTANTRETVEEINPRIDKRFGIALKAGGAWGILGGISVDAFIIPEINVELDYLPIPILSTIHYYGGGINIHPMGSRNEWQLSPYFGLFYGHAEGKAFISGKHEEFDALNIPVGLQFTGHQRRFGFCLEIGVAYTREYDAYAPNGYREEFYPTPSIKFRWGI